MSVKLVFNKQAKRLKDKRPISALALQGTARVAPLIAFTIGLYCGVRALSMGPAEAFVVTGCTVLCLVAAALFAFMFVDVFALWFVKRISGTSSSMDDMLKMIVSKSLKATVIILTIVQVAQIVSGKEISTILAGLGIGGLAFALSAQDTIKNFFGSLVLLADKPFEIGDRIKVDGHDGSVEEVGLRSTRIRTVDGHLTTVPNSEMATTVIQNISRRPHIRRLFNIGLTYDTSPEKIQIAKNILEALLHEHQGMDPEYPPRVYFNDFQDSALNLVCIYWYHPADYWDYMAFTEDLNLKILERFSAEGIEFAYPTQTLQVRHLETS
jgi:MscS family membrane protein